MKNKSLLPLVKPNDINLTRLDPCDKETIGKTKRILSDIEKYGDEALKKYAVKYGDRKEGESLVLSESEIEMKVEQVPEAEIQLLERVATRIRVFAEKQLACLKNLDTDVQSGKAGHILIPVETAGCYAPGGRFPLPSSVLMSVIPARVAGVKNIWLASPDPSPIVMAAAAIAGVDNILAVGGAQSIGALAFGTETVESCDVIVGPGNRWVTAAKMLVAGKVNIDMLAGPSELVVLADKNADPKIIALDLLAQAEHDTDALPVLISDSETLIENVREKLYKYLEENPTETAKQSLHKGFAVYVNSIDQAAAIVNDLAPEHLQLNLFDYVPLLSSLKNYGGLFIGEQSAEVFGDYGIGPNHVLPTSKAARRNSGLSVFTFMKQPTWLQMKVSEEFADIIDDTAALAELEGLKWHAEAAKARRK